MSSVISTHTDIKHISPTVPARANYPILVSNEIPPTVCVEIISFNAFEKKFKSIHEGNNKIVFFFKITKDEREQTNKV